MSDFIKGSKEDYNWESDTKASPKSFERGSYKTINIRFDNEEDYQEFASLVEQKLSDKTIHIWFPKQTIDIV